MSTVNGRDVILIVGGMTISNRLIDVGTPGHIDHGVEYTNRRYMIEVNEAGLPEQNNKPWYQQSKNRRKSY